MTDDAQGRDDPRAAELRAALAWLVRAREALRRNEIESLDELRPRIERCAALIAGLDAEARKPLQPTLLALLDEVETTIAAFRADLERVRGELRSASRSRAAGAAYRHLNSR